VGSADGTYSLSSIDTVVALRGSRFSPLVTPQQIFSQLFRSDWMDRWKLPHWGLFAEDPESVSWQAVAPNWRKIFSQKTYKELMVVYRLNLALFYIKFFTKIVIMMYCTHYIWQYNCKISFKNCNINVLVPCNYRLEICLFFSNILQFYQLIYHTL